MLQLTRLLVDNKVGIVDLIVELAVEIVPLHLEVAVEMVPYAAVETGPLSTSIFQVGARSWIRFRPLFRLMVTVLLVRLVKEYTPAYLTVFGCFHG